jgi:shikimate dehydrogenase
MTGEKETSGAVAVAPQTSSPVAWSAEGMKKGAEQSRKKACVIGWPIKHSRSPLIHNYWLKKYGIDGAYTAEQVAVSELEVFFRDLPKNFAGCNITIPHKEEALNFVHDVAPLAKNVGAINTVVVKDGKLHGFNTDVYGFTKNLESSGKWQKKKPAYIVGAGGAARAVVAALVEAGCEKIYVTNRTIDRLRNFCSELSAVFNVSLHMVGWEDREDPLQVVDLLVNTTSQGMEGQDALDLSVKKLKTGALVSDLVYTPIDTPLLLEAKRRNHPTVDGLGMLLHQAAPGFEAWFGVKPEVDAELRALILKDIAK